MTREYSSISVETTLNSGINTTATTMTLPSIGAVTALLGGVTLDPGNVDIFTVAIDHDTVNEEIVFVTGVSGDTLTISRGQAGTGTAGVSGIAHNAGASIKHVLTSSDLIFFRNGSSPLPSLGFSGSTSGTTTVQATAVAGTNTLTLPPTSNDTLVGRATTDTLTNKTINVANNTLTGVATLAGTETLTNKTLTSPTINGATISTSIINLDLNAQTGTTYTPVLADNGKLVTLSNASAITLTVPTNASVAYPIGAQINIEAIGAGQVTVVGDTGVTVNGTGTKLRVQWSAATLVKLGTDSWTLVGDLS
jgi:hypothetical protein